MYDFFHYGDKQYDEDMFEGKSLGTRASELLKHGFKR